MSKNKQKKIRIRMARALADSLARGEVPTDPDGTLQLAPILQAEVPDLHRDSVLRRLQDWGWIIADSRGWRAGSGTRDPRHRETLLHRVKYQCMACNTRISLGNAAIVTSPEDIPRLALCPLCARPEGEPVPRANLEQAISMILGCRKPEKAQSLTTRLQTCLPDLSWPVIKEQEPLWRKRLQDIRAEHEQKARAEEVELLEALEQKFDHIPNVEWELKSWIRHGKGWIIKIGIYPWGTTFIEGTIPEIKQTIGRILRETKATEITCPQCQQPQSPGCLSAGSEWSCSCGTRFFHVTSQTTSKPPPDCDDSTWPKVAKLLKQATPPTLWNTVTAAIAGGASLEDLYEGAEQHEVLGWPLYSLSQSPRMRDFTSIPSETQLQLALAELKFAAKARKENWRWHGQKYSDWHYTWHGRHKNLQVLAKIEPSGEEPEIGFPQLKMQLPDQVRKEDLDHFFWDQWSMFLIRQPKQKEWQLTESIDFPGADTTDGAYHTGPLPHFPDLSAACTWLTEAFDLIAARLRAAQTTFLRDWPQLAETQNSETEPEPPGSERGV